MVVAPDAGRVKLNKQFATRIGAGLAILDKERPQQQVAEITTVIGDVRGKTAIIVDDMIDTAGTLRAAGEAVVRAGCSRVFAAATHAVFSGSAHENLANSPFERIVVTDTIPSGPEPRRPSTSYRAHRCSPTRSGASSPTTPSARYSGGRTMCSDKALHAEGQIMTAINLRGVHDDIGTVDTAALRATFGRFPSGSPRCARRRDR